MNTEDGYSIEIGEKYELVTSTEEGPRLERVVKKRIRLRCECGWIGWGKWILVNFPIERSRLTNCPECGAAR